MSDGRWLSAEMAGVKSGDLLIYHAGTPGSSYLYQELVKQCIERDLRIVCASRPGYDGSPRLRGRVYADNVANTLALLEFLDVESAYIVGHSGGGGPALADAALLPARVRAAAAISALAPPDAMGSDWSIGLEANEREFKALEEGESRLGQELEKMLEGMAEAKTKDITTSKDFSHFYSPVDQACFKGEYLDFELECRRRIQKGLEGWIDDDIALCKSWGFDLDRVRVPVAIWQGGQDNLIPAAHAEWLESHVPGARYSFRRAEGHISLLNQCFGEILDELIAVAN